MTAEREEESASLWVVSHGQYSDYGVDAVFATEDLAERAAGAANATRKCYDSYYVEELPYFHKPASVHIRHGAAEFLTKEPVAVTPTRQGG